MHGSPTPYPAWPSPILIVLLFIGTVFGILLCEYVNKYETDIFGDLKNEFKIKSVNANVENVKCELEF